MVETYHASWIRPKFRMVWDFKAGHVHKVVETYHASRRKPKFRTVWDFKAQHVRKVVETYYLSYIGQCEILRLSRSIKWGKHTTLVGENPNLGQCGILRLSMSIKWWKHTT